MILKYEDIEMAELELTGSCNLQCPLCVRTNPNFKEFVTYNQRPLSEIIKQLDKFKNLKNMCLAGIMSEPTTYKDLFSLLEYLENRNIKTELYVNGNTKTEEWWYELGKLLKTTKVIFTICGSTQELHEKYRVGSNLQEIYKNAAAFRRSGNKNDYVQLIKFNYNENDICVNYDKIVKDFNNIIEINSLPYQERFNINSDIKMTKNLSEYYIKLMQSQLIKKSNTKITCKSYETKFISIDQYGTENPCFLYKLFGPKEKFDYNYDKICDAKNDFCFECENITTKLIETNNLERMA